MVPALAQDRRCAHGTDVGRLGRGVRPGPATILPDLDALGAVLRDATAGRHGDRRDRRECKAGRAPARRRSGYRDLYHLRGTGLAALLARPQPGAAEPELRPDRHRHEGSCGPRTRQGAARTHDCRRRAAGSSRAGRSFPVRPAGRLPRAVPRDRARPDEGARDRRRGAPSHGGKRQDRRPAPRLERAGEVDPARGRSGPCPRTRPHTPGRCPDAADAALGLYRHAISGRHRAHRRGRARVASERLELNRLPALTITSRNGVAVPLSQVAQLHYEYEEPILWRRNRDMVLTVRGDIVDRVQAPDVSKAVEPKLQSIKDALPYGYRIETGGSIEESVKANSALLAVFPVMAIAMLAILMIQLQSFSRLALVFATAPLGLIGATGALIVSNRPFGFVALLGLIALAGMIMRNTVILVDQIDRDIAAGHGRHRAIIDATVRRARPVILTALAAILGMIPLAESIFWGPMAITIMGGLFVATVLTLLVVPALYAIWFRVRAEDSASEPTLGIAQEEMHDREPTPIRIAA